MARPDDDIADRDDQFRKTAPRGHAQVARRHGEPGISSFGAEERLTLTRDREVDLAIHSVSSFPLNDAVWQIEKASAVRRPRLDREMRGFRASMTNESGSSAVRCRAAGAGEARDE